MTCRPMPSPLIFHAQDGPAAVNGVPPPAWYSPAAVDRRDARSSAGRSPQVSEAYLPASRGGWVTLGTSGSAAGALVEADALGAGDAAPPVVEVQPATSHAATIRSAARPRISLRTRSFRLCLEGAGEVLVGRHGRRLRRLELLDVLLRVLAHGVVLALQSGDRVRGGRGVAPAANVFTRRQLGRVHQTLNLVPVLDDLVQDVLPLADHRVQLFGVHLALAALAPVAVHGCGVLEGVTPQRLCRLPGFADDHDPHLPLSSPTVMVHRLANCLTPCQRNAATIRRWGFRFGSRALRVTVRTYGLRDRGPRCQDFRMPRVSQDHLDARRRQILDGSRVCFARYGYEGATVRRLEEPTGLPRKWGKMAPRDSPVAS